jgi:hypothetical protein
LASFAHLADTSLTGPSRPEGSNESPG